MESDCIFIIPVYSLSEYAHLLAANCMPGPEADTGKTWSQPSRYGKMHTYRGSDYSRGTFAIEESVKHPKLMKRENLTLPWLLKDEFERFLGRWEGGRKEHGMGSKGNWLKEPCD